MGYHRAGFDIIGVDINPQPHYPFRWLQADVMSLELDRFDFDAIHASPPCQAYTRTGWCDRSDRPDLIGPTRELLQASGRPWVMENVPGAPLRADYVLCGSMFGLPRLIRHRWFETSWGGFQLAHTCHHPRDSVSVFGHPNAARGLRAEWSQALGIDWMTAGELSQAIPPAYTEYIGRELMSVTTAGALA